MYKTQNHTVFVLLKLAAFEFGHNMYQVWLLSINIDFLGTIIKSKTTLLEIKHMSFGYTLRYSSLHLASMIPNSPSKTTLPSGVAPKIKVI